MSEVRKSVHLLYRDVVVIRFDKSNSYSSEESERLGRKSYKEQYVYIYK